MNGVIASWLTRKWQAADLDLFKAYQRTFSSPEGQRVLQHLLDQVYCTVYEGTDADAALVQNARRSVVQEILTNIDIGDNPDKYTH